MKTAKEWKQATIDSIKASKLWEGWAIDGNNIVFWSNLATTTLVYDDNDRKVRSITTRHSDGHQTIIEY